MTLLKFLSKLTPDQKKDFLMKLLRDGVPYHRNAIRACATGRRQPSPTLALQIELHSDGLVQRWELRPDIWERPKRIKANGSKPINRKVRATA